MTFTGTDELVAAEARDPHCIEPKEAAAILRPAPWRRLVVIGDSVAAGVREPVAGYPDEGFADRVARALGEGREAFAYLNLGTRDARIGDVRERQLFAALGFNPDLAMVIAGGNDALRRSFDRDVVNDGLGGLIAPLAERGATVLTIGLFDLARSGLVPEPHAGAMAERFDLLDRVTSEVAGELGAIHVDTHHHPLAADPGIFGGDLMHANARGHAIAAAAVVRSLAASLPAVGESRHTHGHGPEGWQSGRMRRP